MTSDTPTMHPAAETSGERIERLRHEWGSHVPLGEGDHAWLLSQVALAIKAAADGADQKLAVYRDVFSEITAKAVPLRYAEDDPDRITAYSVPCGPIHRAAGRLGHQMFNGEQHLLDALSRIAELEEKIAALSRPAAPASEPAVEDVALVDAFGQAALAGLPVPVGVAGKCCEAARTALLARYAKLEAEIKRLEAAFDRRGAKIIELIEIAGAHMCRADTAEAALASAGAGGVVVPDDGWQDISTAPKDGLELDLWERGVRFTDCHWHAGEWLRWRSNSVDDEPHWCRIDRPTHWMRVRSPSAKAPAQPEQNGTTEGE